MSRQMCLRCADPLSEGLALQVPTRTTVRAYSGRAGHLPVPAQRASEHAGFYDSVGPVIVLAITHYRCCLPRYRPCRRPNKSYFEAEWLAYSILYRRFAHILRIPAHGSGPM